MLTKTCIKCPPERAKQDELNFPRCGRNRNRGNVCQTCKTKRQTILRREKAKHKESDKIKELIKNKPIIYYTSIPW